MSDAEARFLGKGKSLRGWWVESANIRDMLCWRLGDEDLGRLGRGGGFERRVEMGVGGECIGVLSLGG